MRFALLILFSLHALFLDAQFKSFSSFHDTLDPEINMYLSANGYEKVTAYYDNINKIDGKWEFYPIVQLNENLAAIAVSRIPGEESGYTYMLLFSMNEPSVQQIFGPYYDSWIDAINAKTKGNEITKMKVRLINPPEPFDPKYTIIEYKSRFGILVNTKTYEKK